MPGPGELPAQQSVLIVGRDAGLARLRRLVDPVPLSSQVLLVTGEAGMGKTVLLADAAERARLAGMRVLSVTGRESESRLAFAGLHQLLRPVLSSVSGLPGRQAQALSVALGLSPDLPARTFPPGPSRPGPSRPGPLCPRTSLPRTRC
jgi:AAA ATPase domain